MKTLIAGASGLRSFVNFWKNSSTISGAMRLCFVDFDGGGRRIVRTGFERSSILNPPWNFLRRACSKIDERRYAIFLIDWGASGLPVIWWRSPYR